MIGATSLVLMMTIPGLALFYAGMVRKKNVLATMAQCMAATFLVSILWAIVGYSLTFTGNGVYIGTLERMFLYGMTLDSISPQAPSSSPKRTRCRVRPSRPTTWPTRSSCWAMR